MVPPARAQATLSPACCHLGPGKKEGKDQKKWVREEGKQARGRGGATSFLRRQDDVGKIKALEPGKPGFKS